jgi:hypothetical protein
MTTGHQFVGTLEARLLVVLADGTQRSVPQLAAASGVAGRRLTNALRELVLSGDVHVSQRDSRSGERHFKRGLAPVKERTPRTQQSRGTAKKSPTMDPVSAAFHAMVALGHGANRSVADEHHGYDGSSQLEAQLVGPFYTRLACAGEML